MSDSPKTDGFIAFLIVFALTWGILYFIVFQNFIDVALQVWGWDFRPVEGQFWWMLVGWFLVTSLVAGMKVYEYSRRGKSITS